MTSQLFLGDCLEIMPTLEGGSVDCVLTDPPYPDYHIERYGYDPAPILYLKNYKCRQLIFWSAKVDFIMDCSSIHIWDKKTGCGSEYERIFERNGQNNYKVFRHYLINSTVAASFTGDDFTGHSSQKPTQLLIELLEYFTKPGQTIFDPFMGSGSVGKACALTGRNFIGIERDKRWFDYSTKRIHDAEQQPLLFSP